MLGFIGRENIASYLRCFRELAEIGKVKADAKSGHRDGWGIVYYRDGTFSYAGREAANALDDEKYEQACKTIEKSKPSMVLAHLRKASAGSKKRENTHPFVYKKWSFCHNGTIKKSETGDFQEPLRNLKMEGDTDSERFFKLVVERIENGEAAQDAIKNLVRSVRSEYSKTTSLTFLFSDGKAVYAYREYNTDSDYYTLFYSKEKEYVLFSQEKRWKTSWEEILNRNLVVVDEDLRIKTVSLE